MENNNIITDNEIEDIKWVEETITSRGFMFIEYESLDMWVHKTHNLIVDITDEGLIKLGHIKENLYSIYKIDSDTRLDRNEFLSEISFYLSYHVNKYWKV